MTTQITPSISVKPKIRYGFLLVFALSLGFIRANAQKSSQHYAQASFSENKLNAPVKDQGDDKSGNKEIKISKNFENLGVVDVFKNLEKECKRVAFEEGFTLEDTYQLALSKMNAGGFKYEPIFVFKKWK